MALWQEADAHSAHRLICALNLRESRRSNEGKRRGHAKSSRILCESCDLRGDGCSLLKQRCTAPLSRLASFFFFFSQEVFSLCPTARKTGTKRSPNTWSFVIKCYFFFSPLPLPLPPLLAARMRWLLSKKHFVCDELDEAC